MIINDDDDDKLPARHRAIIKWLVSDFYRWWSLEKKINNKFWKVLANRSWSDYSTFTSINFLSGFICSMLCISVTFFFI